MGCSRGVPTKTALLSAVAVAAAVLVPVVPATAALSATLEDLAFAPVPYSFQAQNVSGRVVLTATDTSENVFDLSGGLITQSEGWRVTVQAGPLYYTGPNGGAAIPEANLAITSVETPVASGSGDEAVDREGGPKIPDTSLPAPLDVARAVLVAEPGHGTGTYTQGMTLSLTVPGGARAGTYTGTITTTISPGSTP